MILIITIAAVALINSPVSAQLYRWSDGFGGTDDDSGWDVTTDSNGNYYVIGNFIGTIDFGAGNLYSDDGSQDIFLVKFNASGNLVWSKRIGDFCEDAGYGVCTDSSGNVIITGRFCGSSIDFNENGIQDANDPSSEGYGDMFVVKYDGDGVYQWHWSSYGACCGVDEGRSVCADSNDDIWATGIDKVEPYSGPLHDDIFLVKLSGSNGNVISYDTYGATGDDGGLDICAYGTDVTITGYFEESISFDGENYLQSGGLKDIFLATFDSNGDHMVSVRYGNEVDEVATSLCIDQDGKVLLTGYFYTASGYPLYFGGSTYLESNGGKDIFLAKLSRGGTHYWSKSFGDDYQDEGRCVAVHSDGSVVLTGYFTKSADFGFETVYANPNSIIPDAFLARFDASGNNTWSRDFGSYQHEEHGNGIVLNQSGDVISTGYFSSSNVSLGGDDLPYSDGTDIYFAKHTTGDAVENIEVTSTFDPNTYTWDAKIKFETTEPLADPGYEPPVYIHFDPLTCNDDPYWEYQEEGGNIGSTVDSVTLNDLDPSVEYRFYLSAYVDGCWGNPGPTAAWRNTGWLRSRDIFTLTNNYAPIYDISSSFIAVGCKIRVIWYTKFPSTDNMLYYRKEGDSYWISKDPVQEDCDEDRMYVAQFLVQEATDYEFKIRTKIDGVTYWSSVMEESSGRCEDGPIPMFAPDQDLAVPFLEAVPTPFNPTTTLIFNVPVPGDAELTIYGADGRVVKRLVSGFQEKGVNTVNWNATNQAGANVSSGVYFVKFVTSGEILTKKIVLMR